MKSMKICHYPPGNPNNPQTINIPSAAWPAHQAHGDKMGACPAKQKGNVRGGSTNGGSTGNNKKVDDGKTNVRGGGGTRVTSKNIKICHYPPNDPKNPKTITIPEKSWPSHAKHGDKKGNCPPKSGGTRVKKVNN